MITRRTLIAAAAAVTATPALAIKPVSPIAMGRPQPAARRFSSLAVEEAIAQLKALLGTSGVRGKLAAMVENCLPNTLDTTVTVSRNNGRLDTFVITGDIDAMWLRDSTAQLWPYLRFVGNDRGLRDLFAGAVERQTRSILIDPYANAFNPGLTPSAEHAKDDTEMRLGVFERKWELDSHCSVIRLAHGYWRATGDLAPFHSEWADATRLMVATMRVQQRKAGLGPYRLQRETGWNPRPTRARSRRRCGISRRLTLERGSSMRRSTSTIRRSSAVRGLPEPTACLAN